MMDYKKLVEALRNNDWSDACPCCDEAMCKDADCIILQAADAIEALQAENTDIREELFVSQRKYDNFVAVASMENAMLAKQMPKRGEWLNVTDSYHWYGKCSVCGEEFVVDAYYAGGMNYCPSCGAKMEVQE